MKHLPSGRIVRAAAPGRPKQGPIPSGDRAMYSSREGLS